ncbi:MAG: hypothetical protein QIT45_gp10 [Methanophagales virus PBV266]|uniref:Uncharacterized protein n=1 Tax=Methanophagales virus PBV266 TaxID=3071308 RepID=A0AA46TDL0_9VIRU|nr:MAG: hypothetical protein QIT45_gp10 [Methanophagales virus PBV266]UYL65023.1 MAG: hypothetical protein BDLDGNHF_00010 [Methanophagales virus PBV266]
MPKQDLMEAVERYAKIIQKAKELGKEIRKKKELEKKSR